MCAIHQGQGLCPDHVFDLERAVEMREKRAAPRRLPFQRIGADRPGGKTGAFEVGLEEIEPPLRDIERGHFPPLRRELQRLAPRRGAEIKRATTAAARNPSALSAANRTLATLAFPSNAVTSNADTAAADAARWWHFGRRARD